MSAGAWCLDCGHYHPTGGCRTHVSGGLGLLMCPCEATVSPLDQWRVRHPGIGVLTYPDETSARAAAGTAGVVYPPGESHRSTS